MHKRIAIAVAAALIAWASGAPTFAATPPNSGPPAAPFSTAQSETLWQDLNSHAITVTPSPQFAERVGAQVPSSVPLMAMPAKIAEVAPAIKADDYTSTKGKLLIVQPASRKIVDVIRG